MKYDCDVQIVDYDVSNCHTRLCKCTQTIIEKYDYDIVDYDVSNCHIRLLKYKHTII